MQHRMVHHQNRNVPLIVLVEMDQYYKHNHQLRMSLRYYNNDNNKNDNKDDSDND